MDRLAMMNTFVKVVDTGNFTAAAHVLKMSPQSVSNHILQLEDALGVRLLNRTTRKLSLTEIGVLYYGRCRDFILEYDEISNAVESYSSKVGGTLRITSTTSLLRLIMPMISEFMERYPHIAIEINSSDRAVDIVGENFDIAVRNLPFGEMSLVVRKLWEYRFVVCASPAYFSANAAPTHPRDLEKHNILLFSSELWKNKWIFSGPDGEHRVRLSGNMHSNNGDALRLAANDGRGMIVAPDYTIGEYIKSGSLVPVLEEYSMGVYPINIAYLNRRNLPAKVQVFVSFLAERFKADPPEL
jgi:DNA-binding transcriptional LysR family regulator